MWPCTSQSCWAALLLQPSGWKPCASPVCGQNEMLSLSLCCFAPKRVKEESGKAQGEVHFFLSLHSARNKETAGETKRVERQETKWAKLFLPNLALFWRHCDFKWTERCFLLLLKRSIFFYFHWQSGFAWHWGTVSSSGTLKEII